MSDGGAGFDAMRVPDQALFGALKRAIDAEVQWSRIIPNGVTQWSPTASNVIEIDLTSSGSLWDPSRSYWKTRIQTRVAGNPPEGNVGYLIAAGQSLFKALEVESPTGALIVNYQRHNYLLIKLLGIMTTRDYCRGVGTLTLGLAPNEAAYGLAFGSQMRGDNIPTSWAPTWAAVNRSAGNLSGAADTFQGLIAHRATIDGTTGAQVSADFVGLAAEPALVANEVSQLQTASLVVGSAGPISLVGSNFNYESQGGIRLEPGPLFARSFQFQTIDPFTQNRQYQPLMLLANQALKFRLYLEDAVRCFNCPTAVPDFFLDQVEYRMCAVKIRDPQYLGVMQSIKASPTTPVLIPTITYGWYSNQVPLIAGTQDLMFTPTGSSVESMFFTVRNPARQNAVQRNLFNTTSFGLLRYQAEITGDKMYPDIAVQVHQPDEIFAAATQIRRPSFEAFFQLMLFKNTVHDTTVEDSLDPSVWDSPRWVGCITFTAFEARGWLQTGKNFNEPRANFILHLEWSDASAPYYCRNDDDDTFEAQRQNLLGGIAPYTWGWAGGQAEALSGSEQGRLVDLFFKRQAVIKYQGGDVTIVE